MSNILAQLPSQLSQYPILLSSLAELSDREQESHLRNLVKSDLYFLLRYMLNRKDMEHPWLLDRCREVQASPNGHLDLWGREHYKSTIITFGLTIFDILNNPNHTFCLFSHTKGYAKKMLVQIKTEFEINKTLQKLFPEILYADPKKQSPGWSEDGGLVVKRSVNCKERTVEAWGVVDSQPTGSHFTHRIYDDVVTLDSVGTPEQIMKTTIGWEMSGNLGVQNGAERYIGTRYHLHDTYAVMMERKVVEPRIYSATHNKRLDGEPVFLPKEEWAKRLKKYSASIIASQYLQNPLADADAVFNPEWLKGWEVRPRTLNVYIMCDPSMGKSAKSDNTAMAVIGIGAGGAKYLLDGFCHRMPLSERWRLFAGLFKKWSAVAGVQHVAAGYERYGAQTDVEYFEERMKLPGESNFAIKELNWTREGGQSKTHRVQRLEPDFRNSRFYLPHNVIKDGKPATWKVDADPESKTFREIQYSYEARVTSRQINAIDGGSPDLISRALKRVDQDNKIYDLTIRLMEEYLFFPFGGHDDLIDVTSRIYDMEPLAPSVISKYDTDPRVYMDS